MSSEKKFDVVALGEMLIDFTENAITEQGNLLLEANPGGGPANVLSMMANLGHNTAFIGKVGDDIWGRYLRRKAESQGIDLTCLFSDPEIHTTLAFVETFPDGDRDFSFYRKPGADIRLTKDEVESCRDLIADADLFHLNSICMTDESEEEAAKHAMQVAKESGTLICYDPNFRAPLWDSEERAKEMMSYGFENCDMLKISDNEIVYMTGKEDLDEGCRDLIKKHNIPLLLATYGRDGSKAFYKGLEVFVPGFVNPNTIETTGAGDTFNACAMHFVGKYGIDNLDEEKLQELLTFANAAASLVTTRKGALCSMPTLEEVKAYIKESGRG